MEPNDTSNLTVEEKKVVWYFGENYKSRINPEKLPTEEELTKEYLLYESKLIRRIIKAREPQWVQVDAEKFGVDTENITPRTTMSNNREVITYGTQGKTMNINNKTTYFLLRVVPFVLVGYNG